MYKLLRRSKALEAQFTKALFRAEPELLLCNRQSLKKQSYSSLVRLDSVLGIQSAHFQSAYNRQLLTRIEDYRQQSALFHTSSPAYAYELKVPPLAESITEGELSEILVKEGDIVKTDQVLAKIATDKVAVDVFYTEQQTAKVLKINAKEGDTVNVDQCIVELEQGDFGEPQQQPEKKEEPQQQQQQQQQQTQQQQQPPSQQPKPQPPQPPKQQPPKQAQTPTKPGDTIVDASERERRVKMSRLRRRVAERLKGAQNTFALLTTFNEVDMTNLMDLRKKYKDEFNERHGVKLGFMSAFVKAATYALKELPVVNGVIDGDEIIYRDYIDISIAVASPTGLVVPVIRDADQLNFADVERTINQLGKKARDGTIGIDDMAGGTFTISNGGVYGSLLSTPIINPPQSAILGMHSIQERPAVVKGQIMARPLMYIALTYDHRLIDGREAVMFLRKIKDVVEDPTRLLLDI